MCPLEPPQEARIVIRTLPETLAPSIAYLALGCTEGKKVNQRRRDSPPHNRGRRLQRHGGTANVTISLGRREREGKKRHSPTLPTTGYRNFVPDAGTFCSTLIGSSPNTPPSVDTNVTNGGNIFLRGRTRGRPTSRGEGRLSGRESLSFREECVRPTPPPEGFRGWGDRHEIQATHRRHGMGWGFSAQARSAPGPTADRYLLSLAKRGRFPGLRFPIQPNNQDPGETRDL